MSNLENKIYKRNKNTVEYFLKNNYGFSGRHKVDNCRYFVYKVFDKWYHRPNQEFDFDLFMEDLNKVEKCLRLLLRYLDKEDKKLCKEWKCKYEPTRRGFETYGFNNLEGDFSYISDRWMSKDRVQWMLDAMYWYRVKKSIVPFHDK